MFYWPSNGYTEGVTVNVNTTGTIGGRIEYGSDGTEDGKANVAKQAKLIIQKGTFTGEISTDKLNEDNATGIAISGGSFTNPSTLKTTSPPASSWKVGR